MSDIIKEFELFIDSWAVSYNEGDIDTYFDCFTDDAQCYSAVHTPLRFEIGDWFNLIASMGKGMVELRHPSFRIYNENAAFYNAYFVFTALSEEDKPLETLSGRVSVTCVKIDGKS